MATLCSLIETAKMNDVEPTPICATFEGYPINRLDELLPWN
jgi:hypothetical protein